MLGDAAILMHQIDAADGRVVGVDAVIDAITGEDRQRMRGPATSVQVHGARLQTRNGADLEMDLPILHHAVNVGALQTAVTMANSFRVQNLHGFPGVPGGAGFGGVDGAMDAVIEGLLKGRHLRRFILIGARLIAGQIDAYDALVAVPDAQVGDQRRILAHVAHAAQDTAHVDAKVPMAARQPAVDGFHHVGRRDVGGRVDEQLRGVTRFRVDHALRGFVLNKLVGHALDA